MADDPIEEYAQLESNHILLQLVGARPPTGGEPSQARMVAGARLSEAVAQAFELLADRVRQSPTSMEF